MASKGLSLATDRISQAADSLEDADRAATAAAFTPRDVTTTVMQLDDIRLRDTDLRPIREDHVRSIAASIAAVGLISPPAVDVDGQILAGEHRRCALALLRDLSGQPDKVREVYAKELRVEGVAQIDENDALRIASAWEREGFGRGVPVRRMSFVAGNESDRALAVEVAENTQRVDFTKDEILGAYERLSQAGYRTGAGRPKAGQKAIMPALALIFGHHVRTLRHIVNDAKKEKEREAPPKTTVALKKVKKVLRDYGAELPRELKAALRAFEDELDEAMTKRELL